MPYMVNDIFYSLQGEGVRYGTPTVFVRFSGCNLRCSYCDTNHKDYTIETAKEIFKEVQIAGKGCKDVTFTGGEPSLQLDEKLLNLFRKFYWYTSIETNGTHPLPKGLDWITCSPKKRPDGTFYPLGMDQALVEELRYVIKAGDHLPALPPGVYSKHKVLSPMFEDEVLPLENLDHCIQLCLDNPTWRLSVQHHKLDFGGIK